MNDVQMMPHSDRAEKALLGAMIQNPDAAARVISLVSAEDFYVERHRWIYEALQDLSNVPECIPDFVLLCEHLEEKGVLADIGGAAYLSQLSSSCDMSLNYMAYAKRVRKHALLREIIGWAGEIAEEAYKPDADPETVAGNAVRKLLSRRQYSKRKTLNDAVGKAAEYIEKIEAGIDLGGLDPVLPTIRGIVANGRLPPKEMTIIAAGPGLGKTMIGLMICVANVLAGRRMAYVGTEMDLLLLGLRMIPQLTNIMPLLNDDETVGRAAAYFDGTFTSEDLMAGGLSKDVRVLEQKLRDSEDGDRLVIIDDLSDVDEVIARLQAEEMRHGQLDGVVIDYLQMLDAASESSRYMSETQRDDAVGTALLNYSNTTSAHIVAVSSMRKLAKGKTKPNLEDVRGTRKFSYDTGLALILYQDEATVATDDWDRTYALVAKNTRFCRPKHAHQGLAFPIAVDKETALVIEFQKEMLGN